jgi:hypothetical protein
MIYNSSTERGSMSADYHYNAGIVKLPARKSFDELSEYGLLVRCCFKYKKKQINDTEMRNIVQKHLKKRRILMERKKTQRLGKLKRLEILCFN